MRLTRVVIENFKRFERLDVELRPLDCLVGANNSGKTSLLQALALFDFCIHHCLTRRNGDFEIRRRTIPPDEFYVLSAGSGFQQFVYLFGFIHLREPHVVLLDEPDTHLHGTLQSALVGELSRLVGKGKQVLLATHSRDLIREVIPEHVLSLEESGARRLHVAFDVYDTLGRLGSLDPTQLPVIQAYQRVLVVEDQADRDLLFVFCGKCLGPAIWQEAARRLSICFAKGNPYRQPMARLREQLQQMIALRGQTLEAFVVADRDYYPDLEQLLENLPSDHVRWHIWPRAEIENYLLCPEAINRLLRGEQRERVLKEWAFEAEYNRLLEASIDSANDHLVEAFAEYRRRLEKKWDAATLSRKAREYLKEHWPTEKEALADAKGVVLPGIKRWLQENGVGQFSNKALAEALLPSELPPEVHQLARSVAEFAGVTIDPEGVK